jgi:hypothetical protein
MTSMTRHIVFFSAAIVFVASLASDYYLTGIYVYYPRAPDIAAQKVVPYRLKGITVYVTSSEKKQIDMVTLFEIGAGVLVFSMIAVDRIKAS